MAAKQVFPDNIEQTETDAKMMMEVLETKAPLIPRMPEGKFEAKVAAPVRLTNFQAIEKLASGLAELLSKEKAFEAFVLQLQATTSVEKIAFVKLHLCPRVHGLRNVIEDMLRATNSTATPQLIDQSARYLGAMCEVAEQ